MLGAQEIEETFTGLFRSSEAYKSDETNETLITPAVPKMRINPAIARVNLRLVALATIVITLFAVLTCRASASSTFSYALTTTTDPARPGQMVQFELTASNLTNAAQYLSVGYLVPQFTTSINGYAAGTALTYTFGYIPAGVSQSIYLDFKVLNGTQAPPDGSLVNLVVSDPARSASVSRTAMVKSAPAAALDLSTQQGSVAPGGSFSYTLAYHNASSSSLSGSQLSLPIPVGATFVSADGGGVKGTDGVVRWSPSALGAGATGEVHLSLKSSTTPAIQAALLIQAAWRNSSSQILAQASDAKAVYASPAFSYAMTTTTDPVKPGQVVQFRLTASNLTNAAQYLSVGYHVPQFTTSINGYAAGTALSYTFGYIAEGTTEAVYLDFKVLSSTQNPPDGSLVTLEISDQATGASVSRTAMVKSAPAAALDLSTQQGSVAPGGSFSYTLAYHNASSSSLSGSQLSLPIPVGATFVSADGGGIKGTDGVVRWSPSVLGAGATGEVHLSLKSSTTPAIQAALPIQAAWTNSSSQILAQASDAKAVYASPALSYALTTTDPVKPGQVVQFKLTASNLTNAAQYLSVGYHVPQFTTSINGYAAGTALSYTFGYIAAGTSEAVDLDFKVLSSTQNPPDGSLVTLEISNQASGASVSRTATVKSAPAAALDLSTQQGSVAPGGSFSYTLAYHNASSSSLSGSQLSLPIPVGATLVSADGGGVKGTDGVVRWSPSVLGAGATGEVHLSLKSSTTPAIQAALLIEAAWTNSSSQILARASDAKAVYASPAFSYGLTASGPAIPGHAIQFKLTVTNATNAAQYLSVGYHVPQFTTSTTGYAAGTALSYTFGNVAAGASQSVTLSFNVLSGTQTPPNGSLVTLVISDQARAVTVSRTSAINQTIALIDWTDSFSRNLVLIFQGEPLAFRYSPFSDLGQDSRTIVAGGVSGDCISL